MHDAAERILELAEQHGFALAGIADAAPSPRAEAVRRWVAEGRHGTMGWLAENLDVRVDLGRLLEGARSVIALADVYAQGGEADRDAEPAGGQAEAGGEAEVERPRGRVARYARGDDYHKVIKTRLHAMADALAAEHPGVAFRSVVDTAPALEREAAARAGLGWQAKNTMMIHPRHGSYTLLGLIVTTLRLEGPRGKADQGQSASGDKVSSKSHLAPLPLGPSAPSAGGCANCTRCIDACPTDAIAPAGYAIDASRCISYLTIEHRGPIEPALQPAMRDWIAGCDICQEVCPYNAIAARQPLPIPDPYDPAKRGLDAGLDLLEVLDWSAEVRQAVFQGSALKRIKLDMIRRNALIALANACEVTPRPQWRQRIERCLDDESDLVSQTAAQVLERLKPPPGAT